MSIFEQYVGSINEKLQRILDEESDNLRAAGKYIAEWLAKDDKNLLYVIGTGGHSMLVVQEIFQRAGGLSCIKPILSAAVFYETIPGMITKDLQRYDIPEGAPVIIASHVGMNQFTIETAKCCKDRGMFVVGIEATEILRQLPEDFEGWAQKGVTLRDFCDVCIDHKTPYGDAALYMEGIKAPVGPVSDVLLYTIMHLLEVAIYEHMAKIGYQPLLFISQNIPGGAENNALIYEKYINDIRFW